MEKRLVPYSVYIPKELHTKLKRVAKARKASSMVRDAIRMIIDGNDAYQAGYRKGLEDASKVVFECPEAQMVAVKGKDIGAYLCEQIKSLEA
jgi:predicted transcriptional regulator